MCRQEPESRKGKLMEISKSKPWPIPKDGFYLISLTAARLPGEMIDVETERGLAAMMDNIRHVRRPPQNPRLRFTPSGCWIGDPDDAENFSNIYSGSLAS